MQSALLAGQAPRRSIPPSSRRAVKSCGGGRRSRQQAAPSVERLAPIGLNHLALPELDLSIPVLLEPPRARQKGVQLALGLLDSGIVKSASPDLAKDPIAASKLFLEQWVRRELSGLSILDLHFRLLLRNMDAWGNRLRDEEMGEAQVAWYSEVQPLVVGPAFEKLEAIQEGLGALVLTVIERKCHLLVPIFTPTDVLCVVRDFQWYGAEDEKEALEQDCSTEEEKEAMRAEMITREELDAAFPKWATQWVNQRRTPPLKVLERVAQQAASPMLKRVASNALALQRLRVTEAYRAQGEGWFIGYGGVFCWSKEDLATRAFDDMANHAMEGELVDWCGEAELDVTKPETIKQWVTSMGPVFEGVRLLDALIKDLTEGDWTKVTKKGIR